MLITDTNTDTSAAVSSRVGTGHRILVVDHAPTGATPLLPLLAATGYDARTASGPGTVVHEAAATPPDLIILRASDNSSASFEEACRGLRGRAETASIPIILITRTENREGEIEGLQAGAADCIPAPVDGEILLARVAAHIRTKTAHEQTRREQEQQFQTHRTATVGTLAGGIAHEFNNLATAIVGYAELALAHNDADTLKRSAEVALENGQRVAAIAGSLARFAAPLSGDMCLVDVNALIDDILDLIRGRMEREGITLQIDLGDVPRIYADPGALREALLNILTNAHQALAGHRGRMKIEVETRQESDDVVISISDNGVGISTADLHRVFDPFFTTKGVLGGGNDQNTGLGLSIAESVARSHGGGIEIHSEPGQDTRIVFSLPVTQPGQQTRTANVLVVDDEPMILKIFSRFITRAGHSLDTASNGREALDMIRANDYDVILLDWMMPEVSGGDVLNAVREMDDVPPIVVVTAGYSLELATKAVKAGARECIGKPLNHRKVIYLIEKYAGLQPSARTGKNTSAEGRGDIVLIGDRHPVTAELIMLMLRHAGYEAVIAHDARTVLEAIRKEYFDLILIDAGLVATSDTDIVRESKRLNPYTPMVVMADNPADASIQRSLAAGAAGSVNRPMHIVPFIEKVRDLIDTYREPAGLSYPAGHAL